MIYENIFHLKVLGLFNLIQFSNSRCNSTDSDKQGVCYTATECQGRGGTPKGNCAQGFGVCCLCKYTTIIFPTLKKTF